MSFAQLKYIFDADSTHFYSTNDSMTHFPLLDLKQKKNLDLYYQNSLVFAHKMLDSSYSSMMYELFTSNYLLITYRRKTDSWVSSPSQLNRNRFCLINLTNKTKYFGDFKGIKICYKDEFEYYKKYNHYIYYLDSIKDSFIFLKDIFGKSDTIKMIKQ